MGSSQIKLALKSILSIWYFLVFNTYYSIFFKKEILTCAIYTFSFRKFTPKMGIYKLSREENLKRENKTVSN